MIMTTMLKHCFIGCALFLLQCNCERTSFWIREADVEEKKPCHFPEWEIENREPTPVLGPLLKTMDHHYQQVLQGDTMVWSVGMDYHSKVYFVDYRANVVGEPKYVIRKPDDSNTKLYIFERVDEDVGLTKFIEMMKTDIVRQSFGYYYTFLGFSPGSFDSFGSLDPAKIKKIRATFTPPQTPTTALPTTETIGSFHTKDALFNRYLMELYLFSAARGHEHDTMPLGKENTYPMDICAEVEDSHSDQVSEILKTLSIYNPEAVALAHSDAVDFEKTLHDPELGSVVVLFDGPCHNEMGYLLLRQKNDEKEVARLEFATYRGDVRAVQSFGLYLRRKSTNEVWSVNLGYYKGFLHGFPTPTEEEVDVRRSDEETKSDLYIFFA